MEFNTLPCAYQIYLRFVGNQSLTYLLSRGITGRHTCQIYPFYLTIIAWIGFGYTVPFGHGICISDNYNGREPINILSL